MPKPRRRGRSGGQEQADRGEPAPCGLHCEEVFRPRPAYPRPHSGGQHGPDPRGGQVRLYKGKQILYICDLVDPAGNHTRHCRSGQNDPRLRCIWWRSSTRQRAATAGSSCRSSAASRPLEEIAEELNLPYREDHRGMNRTAADTLSLDTPVGDEEDTHHRLLR